MSNWNHAFCDLIRGSRAAHWGNWGLNMMIKPGAVGMLDPATGEFRLVCEELPGVQLIDKPISSTWQLSSTKVSRTETNFNIDGSGTDPDSGTKVEAGLKVAWSMSNAGSLVSEFALMRESAIADFGTVLQGNIDFLAAKAASVGMGSDGNISQGFGVITSVLWAHSGLNIGAEESDSSFSISGTVAGVNEMLGKIAGDGSYLSTEQKKTFDRHMWPEQAGTTAATPVPIAFTFASFDKRTLIPNWIMHLDSFQLILDNLVGCTYVTHYDLSYTSGGKPCGTSGSISGGLTQTLALPLDATMVKLRIKFKGIWHDDAYNFEWDNPLGQWLTGQRHIDMSGVWPGKTHCHVREGQ